MYENKCVEFSLFLWLLPGFSVRQLERSLVLVAQASDIFSFSLPAGTCTLPLREQHGTLSCHLSSLPLRNSLRACSTSVAQRSSRGTRDGWSYDQTTASITTKMPQRSPWVRSHCEIKNSKPEREREAIAHGPRMWIWSKLSSW